MQRRGRSRHVSPVALARLASEERRLALAPPEPPLSLEDQIQVAYAHDNIRLAKILLLKLKGVHVDDDTDPRIDQVRDEDFDVCFAPSGPLTLDDADKRAVQETQRRQRQSWHESQRAQRLRACEKLWEDDKNRLRQDRLRARQRREQDHGPRPSRPRIETPVSTRREQDPFQYSFMPPSVACRSPKKVSVPSACHSRSVSFKEVITAMNGKLFPLDASERADDARRIAGISIPGSACHKRKASVRAELLDSLLQVVEWQQGERRKAKGKDVDRGQQPKSPPRLPAPVPLVPSSVSATSISSTSPSRSSSWLSFGSWRSTATDFTTPDSPVSSPISSHCLIPTLADYQRDLHPRSAFVRISVQESPLSPQLSPLHAPTPLQDDDESHPIPCASPSIRGTLVKHVTRSVATFVEAAKGLQSAYIAATIFTVGSPHQLDCANHRPSPCHQARPEGYRALAEDVRKFTNSPAPISHMSGPVHFIPLVSQSSESAGLSKPPAPKNVVIFPSPLRPRTPPSALAYRMRPVANPAVLRLRALQNIMYARGKEWEGRAREGGLGCGKERMLGIAFEGRGRSGLGCEVRFVVA